MSDLFLVPPLSPNTSILKNTRSVRVVVISVSGFMGFMSSIFISIRILRMGPFLSNQDDLCCFLFVSVVFTFGEGPSL